MFVPYFLKTNAATIGAVIVPVKCAPPGFAFVFKDVIVFACVIL